MQSTSSKSSLKESDTEIVSQKVLHKKLVRKMTTKPQLSNLNLDILPESVLVQITAHFETFEDLFSITEVYPKLKENKTFMRHVTDRLDLFEKKYVREGRGIFLYTKSSSDRNTVSQSPRQSTHFRLWEQSPETPFQNRIFATATSMDDYSNLTKKDESDLLDICIYFPVPVYKFMLKLLEYEEYNCHNLFKFGDEIFKLEDLQSPYLPQHQFLCLLFDRIACKSYFGEKYYDKYYTEEDNIFLREIFTKFSNSKWLFLKCRGEVCLNIMDLHQCLHVGIKDLKLPKIFSSILLAIDYYTKFGDTCEIWLRNAIGASFQLPTISSSFDASDKINSFCNNIGKIPSIFQLLQQLFLMKSCNSYDVKGFENLQKYCDSKNDKTTKNMIIVMVKNFPKEVALIIAELADRIIQSKVSSEYESFKTILYDLVDILYQTDKLTDDMSQQVLNVVVEESKKLVALDKFDWLGPADLEIMPLHSTPSTSDAEDGIETDMIDVSDLEVDDEEDLYMYEEIRTTRLFPELKSSRDYHHHYMMSLLSKTTKSTKDLSQIWNIITDNFKSLEAITKTNVWKDQLPVFASFNYGFYFVDHFVRVAPIIYQLITVNGGKFLFEGVEDVNATRILNFLLSIKMFLADISADLNYDGTDEQCLILKLIEVIILTFCCDNKIENKNVDRQKQSTFVYTVTTLLKNEKNYLTDSNMIKKSKLIITLASLYSKKTSYDLKLHLFQFEGGLKKILEKISSGIVDEDFGHVSRHDRKLAILVLMKSLNWEQDKTKEDRKMRVEIIKLCTILYETLFENYLATEEHMGDPMFFYPYGIKRKKKRRTDKYEENIKFPLTQTIRLKTLKTVIDDDKHDIVISNQYLQLRKANVNLNESEPAFIVGEEIFKAKI